MKTRIPAAIATAIAALSITACSSMTREEKGAVAGAAVGGVVGSAATDGSTLGTVGGAAGGALLGNEVGKRRDRR